jgi:hypothetical protein
MGTAAAPLYSMLTFGMHEKTQILLSIHGQISKDNQTSSAPISGCQSSHNYYYILRPKNHHTGQSSSNQNIPETHKFIFIYSSPICPSKKLRQRHSHRRNPMLLARKFKNRRLHTDQHPLHSTTPRQRTPNK